MACGSQTAGPTNRRTGCAGYRRTGSANRSLIPGSPRRPDAAGEVPQAAVAVAEEAFGKLGLPGLVLAGVDDHGQPWELARGWARLDPQEPL